MLIASPSLSLSLSLCLIIYVTDKSNVFEKDQKKIIAIIKDRQ